MTPSLSPQEHYEKAEQLLSYDTDVVSDVEMAEALMAAHVHALLAQVPTDAWEGWNAAS